MYMYIHIMVTQCICIYAHVFDYGHERYMWLMFMYTNHSYEMYLWVIHMYETYKSYLRG